MLTHTTYGNNTLKPKSPRTSFKNLTNPNVYKENRRTQNEALDSPKKNLDKHLQKIKICIYQVGPITKKL